MIAHKNLKIDPNAVYSKTNEWMRADGDVITVGITDYAQAAMRGMDTDEHLQSVYVLGSLKVGDHVMVRDVIGEVHSSKTSSDIYSPVSGEIVAINGAKELGVYLMPRDEIEDKYGIKWKTFFKVERDPYGDGWLVRVKADMSGKGANCAPMSPAAEYAVQSAKEYADHYGDC